MLDFISSWFVPRQLKEAIRTLRQAKEALDWARAKKDGPRLKAEAGDVIGVSRGPYQHYAVYLGNDEVIHYAAPESDFRGLPMIRRAPLSRFLGNQEEFFILMVDETRFDFDLDRVATAVVDFDLSEALVAIRDYRRGAKYRVYSQEETIERAMSRIGETKYNIATNNCEHFALWCKTGISESRQIKKVLRLLPTVGARKEPATV